MEVKIFKELTTEAKMIRTKVFMEEQGFHNEFDEKDRISIHIVLFELSKPVATCSSNGLPRKGCRKQAVKGGRERNS